MAEACRRTAAPQSGYVRNGLNVVPAESGEEGEPAEAVPTSAWQGQAGDGCHQLHLDQMRVDKVARQSEKRGNKTTQLEVKMLKTANHR